MHKITVSHIIYFKLLEESLINADMQMFHRWLNDTWSIKVQHSDCPPDLFLWDLIFSNYNKYKIFKIKYSELIASDIIEPSLLQ